MISRMPSPTPIPLPTTPATVAVARSPLTRRLRASLVSAPLAVAIGLGVSPASAQQPQANCPPGSWFCADTQEKPAALPGQPVVGPAPSKLEPLPSEGAPAPAAPSPTSGPTIIYQTAPPQIIYQQAPPAQPPPVVYQPPPPSYRPPPPPGYRPPPPPGYRQPPPPPYYYRARPAESVTPPHEWGLNFRVEGALLGHTAVSNSGMGGVGLGLRYKPIPQFGIEADVDFWGGRDYYGDRRNETSFQLNALVFVNPRSRVQVYFLAGLGWSSAQVNDDSLAGAQANYTYFGGQAGGGLEFRLGRHFALNADVRGFIRGRTDDGAQTAPEFVNPQTGQTTNTSGGGIVTGGMTFYF